MLNKYGEMTQPCRTPFLIGNHSDSVPVALTLVSCFLYSLASKSIKFRGYPVSIIVTQRLSWEIESNAFLKSKKHIQSGCWCISTILRFVIWSLVPFPCRNPASSSAISVSVFTRILSSMIRRRILLACKTRAIVL